VTTDAQDLADAVRGVMYTDYFATAADDEATAVLASPVAPTTPAAATFVEDDGVPFSSVIEARFDASPAPDSAAAARAVAAAAAAAAVAASVDDSWIEAPDVNPAALDRELRAMAARSPQRSFSPQPAAAGRAGAGASAVASPVSPAQKKTPFYHHTPSAAAATAPGATAASSPLRAGGAGTVFYVRGDVDIEYEEPVSASARARSPFTAPAAIISSPQNQRTAAAAAAATAAVGGSPVLHHRYASADDDDYDGDGYDDEDEDAGADEDYYSDRDVEFNPDTDADAEDAYAGGGVGAGAGTGVRANLQETLARAAYAQQQQQHQLQAGVEQSEQRVLFVPAQAPGEPDLFVRASYTRTEEIVPAVVPVAAVAAAGPAPVSAEASLCAQADALAETHDYDAVYDLLHSGASAAAVEASAELLWRAARAAYHTAKAFAKRGDADAVRVRATEGYATAQRAVERDDGCAHAHKWVAILGNQVGELGGQQAKISQAHSFQRHVQRALALSPDDADLHHMMGRFCFEIASLSWTVRKIADVAFGGLPRVSLDDAVRHFRDAERGEPKWALNLVWLGKALAKVGRTAEAEESLAAALALPAERLEDEEAHALARKELEAM
jgi:tetratricopeptide (TPR) repeat protein